jgi:adenylate kinase
MSRKIRTVLLFGAPGAGKGTQGRILEQVPNWYYFASGDAFRNLRPEDPLGKTFLDFSSRGELVPDEFTIALWQKKMESATIKGSFQPDHDVLLLDGIPRNRHQVEMMEEHIEILALLHLTCQNKQQMVERIQRRALIESRLDDANLEVIEHRFETYEEETRSVIDAVPSDLVHDVNADQSPILVLKDILDSVSKLHFSS